MKSAALEAIKLRVPKERSSNEVLLKRSAPSAVNRGQRTRERRWEGKRVRRSEYQKLGSWEVEENKGISSFNIYPLTLFNSINIVNQSTKETI